MPNRSASVLMAFVLGSPPVAALAQPASAPSTTLPPLTVQGAATPKTVLEQTRSFVQSYAAPTAKIDQIARWHEGICVRVEGLVPAQAAQVSGRINDVARAVGLPVLKPGCRSNIQVVFTDQPQRLADKLSEQLLGFHYQNETRKIRTITHPIQAWYATTTAGAGGATGLAFGSAKAAAADDPSNYIANFGQIQGVQASLTVADSPESRAPVGCADAPHFTSCMRSMFGNVMIIADTKAIAGKNLGVLTDYLAMLALSQPRSLDGCNALPSVIDALAKTACPGRDPPDGLTPTDSSYLTALYASDSEAKMALAQGDIANRMADMLVKAKAAAR